MSVATNGAIAKEIRLEEVLEAVQRKFNLIYPLRVEFFTAQYATVTFKVKEEYRTLAIHLNYFEPELKKTITLLDFSKWLNSEELMESIVEEFGGLLLADDRTTDWRTVLKKQETV